MAPQTMTRCQQWLLLFDMRDRVFPNMGECSWRILLTLHGRGPECVTSLCVTSGSPQTTALRHLEWLERDRLITRSEDPADGRRLIVSLTDLGSLMMMQATGEVGRHP